MSSPFPSLPIPCSDVSPSGRTAVDDLRTRVARSNPDLDRSSNAFRTALVLLAAPLLEQNVDRIALFIGEPREFVARCARRLVDNGVWQDGTTVCGWKDVETEPLAFWGDVAVGEGKLCRRRNESGFIEWAPAGFWRKQYDYVQRPSRQQASVRYVDPSGRDAGEACLRLQEIPPSGGRRVEASPPAGAVREVEPPAFLPARPREASAVLGSPELFRDTIWLK